MTIGLEDMAVVLLEEALSVDAGRAAHSVVGGSSRGLRQTLIALRAGEQLAEHSSPGQATLQVLLGEIALCTPEGTLEATCGDLLVIPPERHSVEARSDSVFLLTIARH
jgi:quercetin dioxygenase-like cupin family protein